MWKKMEDLRCPECNEKVFTSPLFPGMFICRDMGHWMGEDSDCIIERGAECGKDLRMSGVQAGSEIDRTDT